MRAFELSHLGDAALLHDLNGLVARDRATTAVILAHIAEVDARRLYAPTGYPSMFAFCVGALHLSEDSAYKRIHAARVAREFPILFEAMSDGRLHLTAVRLLAPHLTTSNVDELVAAATHRPSSEIEEMLACRFPKPETLAFHTLSRVAANPVPGGQLAAGQVGTPSPVASAPRVEFAAEQVPADSFPSQLAARQVGAPETRIAPLSAERFSLQVTIDRETRDRLEYAQALLSHAVPGGDVAQVLHRALEALINQLEKRKFAAADRPGRSRPGERPRHISATVRRAVWARDEGRCSFVAEGGWRCSAREFLEFDHAVPVAHGGKVTVEGIRLRCRAHNQLEAERAFGKAFMEEKRREARDAAPDDPVARDLLAGLRNLGVRADVARRATEVARSLPDAGLEERMRAALKFLGPKSVRVAASGFA